MLTVLLLPSAVVMIDDGYAVQYDVFEINVHDIYMIISGIAMTILKRKLSKARVLIVI